MHIFSCRVLLLWIIRPKDDQDIFLFYLKEITYSSIVVLSNECLKLQKEKVFLVCTYLYSKKKIYKSGTIEENEKADGGGRGRRGGGGGRGKLIKDLSINY